MRHAIPFFALILYSTTSLAQVIVQLAPDADPIQVAKQYGIEIAYVYTDAFNGFAGKFSDATRISPLKADARVLEAESDAPLSLEAFREPPSVENWGLDRIDQRTLPLDAIYHPDATGLGVTAYVLDSGMNYNHPEFEGRASFGFDVSGGNGVDCDGHGTHVAGIIGGKTYGVAKNVRLVSVDIFPCHQGGAVSSMIAGVDWVIRHHRKVSVANFSIIAPASLALDTAVRKLIRSGVPLSSAAGNKALDACGFSPGRVPEVMNIGASDLLDQAASWSNYGSCVSWFAPGVGITSAGILPGQPSLTLSGTSMAAPHNTGAAALYLEKHPNASATDVKEALRSFLTKDTVRSAREEARSLLYVREEVSE